MIARLAHRAWVALNSGRDRRFRRALRDPTRAQDDLLKRTLQRNADTVIGRRYGFDRIDSLETFQRRVPIRSYDEMAEDIERVRGGESNVLTHDEVVRLVPSSGSTAARKLIPFTRQSQEEFQRAVGPWIVDLHRRRPQAFSGRAYWSVSPKATDSSSETAAQSGPVAVGFDEDADYLGGVAARLVNHVLAVPSSVRHLEDLETFRFQTLRHLLAARDLSLISVWHPSFLTLLLGALPAHWDRLLDELPARRRRELRVLDPHDLTAIWPRLDVVSCWRDAHAVHPARDLERRLPEVAIEAKGLVATEAVVTLPYQGRHPVAVRSHLFEFLDEDARALGVADLQDGAQYTVVVTTGGGLYRYRLGDRVRARGFLGRTQCLEFLGRDDRVCDLRGEKLSEGFVAGVLKDVLAGVEEHVRFALLAPADSGPRVGDTPHYRLFLESDVDPPGDLDKALDEALNENPHYRLARDLGQLGAADVVRVGDGAHQRYLEAKRAAGQGLGDVKPAVLEVESGWML